MSSGVIPKAVLARMAKLGVHVTRAKVLPTSTHRVLKLSTNRGPLLAKRLAASPALLDRNASFRAQRHLAAQELAPEPVMQVSAVGEHWHVERWHEGLPLTGPDVDVLAYALSEVHNTRVPVQPLDIMLQWQHYVSQLPEAEQPHWQQQLDAMASLAFSVRPQAVCHHDLTFAHVLGQSDHLRIVDWEYIALSEPALDIAFCILTNSLSAECGRALVAAYANWATKAEIPLQARVVQLMPVADLSMRLWISAHEQGHSRK